MSSQIKFNQPRSSISQFISITGQCRSFTSLNKSDKLVLFSSGLVGVKFGLVRKLYGNSSGIVGVQSVTQKLKLCYAIFREKF